jgi:hypothetical protein
MAQDDQSIRHPRWRTMLFSIALVFGLGAVVSPQVQLDVCGCKNNPASLGNFDTADLSTYPPGSTSTYNTVDVPLPADGVLVFNSITVRERAPYVGGYNFTLRFIRNAANTPVTLLVKGDLYLGYSSSINVSGADGVGGSTNILGKGALGGPGGFRGGDGAYQLVNFATVGGAGLGPGGGAGGTSNYPNNGHGVGGTFLGAPDLLPLVGGSGGGGGSSIDPSPGCAGGGGGGGGGAILVAVNGTISFDGGSILADGGGAGGGNYYCSSSGGGGSGGAVRILATTINGNGSGFVYARPGNGGSTAAQYGAIRLEALNNNLTVGNTSPLATRAAGPGPIVNPITPTVAITTVGGQPISQPPQGGLGNIDLVLPAPGQTDIGLVTSGVPAGTTVNVTVKPRVGSAPITTPIVTPVTLTNCDPSGACLASATFNLAAGAYFVEARATFQTPTP